MTTHTTTPQKGMDHQRIVDALYGFKNYHMPLSGANNQISAADERAQNVPILNGPDTSEPGAPLVIPNFMLKSACLFDFNHQVTALENNTMYDTIHNMALITLETSQEPLWLDPMPIHRVREVFLKLRRNGMSFPLPESACLYLYKQLWRPDVQLMLQEGKIVAEMCNTIYQYSDLVRFNIMEHAKASSLTMRLCVSHLSTTAGQNSFVNACSELSVMKRMRLVLNCNPVPLSMVLSNPVAVVYFFFLLYGVDFANFLISDREKCRADRASPIINRSSFVHQFEKIYQAYANCYVDTDGVVPMATFEEFLYAEFTSPCMNPEAYLYTVAGSKTQDPAYRDLSFKNMLEPSYRAFHFDPIPVKIVKEPWVQLMQRLIRSVGSQEAAYRIGQEVMCAFQYTHLAGYQMERVLCRNLSAILKLVNARRLHVSPKGECFWHDKHKVLATAEIIHYNELFSYHPFAAWLTYDIVAGVSHSTHRKAPDSFISF